MANTDITKIPAPRTPLIDENSGDMTPAWYRFFYNIFTILGDGSGILPTTRGGTGRGQRDHLSERGRAERRGELRAEFGAR